MAAICMRSPNLNGMEIWNAKLKKNLEGRLMNSSLPLCALTAPILPYFCRFFALGKQCQQFVSIKLGAARTKE